MTAPACLVRELWLQEGWGASLWFGGLPCSRKHLTFVCTDNCSDEMPGLAATFEQKLRELESWPRFLIIFLRLSYSFDGDSVLMTVVWTHAIHFRNSILIFFFISLFLRQGLVYQISFQFTIYPRLAWNS